MKKIAIAGIGGVGGFFGGKLARYYQYNDSADIYFIARGEHLQKIKTNGLTVETTDGDFVAVPALASSDPNEVGIVDLLICCTKAYDLEQSLLQLKPCIGPQTVILSLLNGVDNTGKIKTIYPANEVLSGCVYLVARLAEPGLIRETGRIGLLYFGSATAPESLLVKIEKLLVAANIQAFVAADIENRIWTKFLFISASATLTSWLDKGIGEILADDADRALLENLLKEAYAVAIAKNILLEEDIVQKTIEQMRKLPFESTSSMHSDFKKGNQTELESLTGYLVRSGHQLNIAVPLYEKIYTQLKDRTHQSF